jgi:uncharacterized protein (DUF2336 family)
MIVEDFLGWVVTAPAAQRAEAAHTLARAYLHSKVAEDVREGMEAAITLLLDDQAPDVRFALADALAGSPDAPRHVILMLAADHIEIASLVLSRSPQFLDSELVDIVAGMEDPLQCAVASRPALSAAVSAAIAEVGCVEACRLLCANPGARLARISLRRMVERHGADPDIRESLLSRPALPAAIRQMLIRQLGEALSTLVSARAWIDSDRVAHVAREACDRATVAIAAETESEDLVALVEHLRVTGQLTTSLLLRALCAGNVGLFAAALAALSDTPEPRVRSLVLDGRLGALKAIYARSGLPAVAFEAFAVALNTWRDRDPAEVDPRARYRFIRKLVEEVVTRYQRITDGEMNELLGMLRRFAADAARAAAREYAASAGRAA